MPSNIPLWTFGVAFRLRLVTFTEQAHRAYMPLSGILAWRRGLQTGLRHGDPFHKHLSGILAWRGGLLTGLRHGDPFHKHLSGILAWRRGHLSTLWHGDPQQNHFWGRVAWQDCLEPVLNRSLADASAGFRHGIPGARPLGGIPAWQRGFSDRSLAQPPCPQVPQWHPRVARGASIDPLARGPSTEPLLGQGHVARLSGSGVKPVSCRCFGRTSTRHPRREASRWHPGVAKRTSIDPLARGPLPQAPRWHPRVAKGTSIDPLARGPSTEPLLGHGHVARLSGSGVKPVSCRCFGRTSPRHPRLEASRWHPGVARQSSIGSSSMKCRYSMDIEVRMGCLSIKCRYSMDIEVRIGFLSMKCRCFMDVEVQIGCSARCPACGNSRLYSNVADLASLPFLPNEGACPKYTPSARIHCILERTLVSLTPKHPFSQFHPCQSVSEDRLFYEYDFSNKLGDIFS